MIAVITDHKKTLCFQAREVLYDHLDREKMADHIGAVVPIVLVWLSRPIGIFGPGQQSVSAGLFWRRPVKFPASPRVTVRGIEKLRFGPGLATIGAHGDLGGDGLARPGGTKNRVHAVR